MCMESHAHGRPCAEGVPSSLDRLGYPPEEEEVAAVVAHCASSGMPDLDALGVRPLLRPEELDALAQVPAAVRVEGSVARYAVALARATREHPSLADRFSAVTGDKRT